MLIRRRNDNSNQPGFTIVELLIVVVVIAILAAITLVSYNGIQNRAKTASLQSDLRNAAVKITNDFTLNSTYPATLAEANNGQGIRSSNGATLAYIVDNVSDPKTFCVTGTLGTLVYKVDQKNTVTTGSCTDGPVTPSRLGYTNDYSAAGADFTVTPSSTIPDGSWMIMAMVFTNDYPVNTPSGWTVLVSKQTAGSMQFIVFGKIKTSSDGSSYAMHSGYDQTSSNTSIMWGSGAMPVSNWTVGSLGFRGTNGTSFTNVAPSISAPTKSLVLTLSAERTNVDETNVSSISGATPWLFMAQTSSKLQTLSVSYTEPTTALTTNSVTITYPNTQTVNGIAFQIAIPAVTP